jgi:hypothetical protein
MLRAEVYEVLEHHAIMWKPNLLESSIHRLPAISAMTISKKAINAMMK